MNRAARRTLAALCLSVVTLTACSDDADSSADPTSTTPTTVVPGCTAEKPVDPILPTDLNAIPYQVTDNVALGDFKVRIHEVTDPWTQQTAPAGQRYVAVDLEVENGAAGPQTVEPDVFVLYDTKGCGTKPVQAKSAPPLSDPLASAAVAKARFVYEVPTATDPSALLFRGTETYGPKVLNGLIALDPTYVPPNPES